MRLHLGPLGSAEALSGLRSTGALKQFSGKRDPPGSGRPQKLLHVGSERAGPQVAAIVSIVETCRRLNIPVRLYLDSILPGLANFPGNWIAELAPTAWAAGISRLVEFAGQRPPNALTKTETLKRLSWPLWIWSHPGNQ